MKRSTSLRPAVFLDRDGTINVEKDYLVRVADFVFIAGSDEAILRLNRAGLMVVVVTNQSGVARGFFDLAAVDRLHEHLRRQLARIGARIDAFYTCPHHPTEGVDPWRQQCDCRKGRPGMLLQAAKEHGIDLAASYMVGDKAADMDAGCAAGCQPLLVLTGYGVSEQRKISETIPRCADLGAAVDLIIANMAPGHGKNA